MGLLNRAQEIFGKKVFREDVEFKGKIISRGGNDVYAEFRNDEPSGGTWHKVADPPTGWLASKLIGWTADSFIGGLTVDFTNVVPAGTKAVRCVVFTPNATVYAYWRPGGASEISDTPGASSEFANRIFYGAGALAVQTVFWLSSSYTVDIAINGTGDDIYVSYPIEYML